MQVTLVFIFLAVVYTNANTISPEESLMLARQEFLSLLQLLQQYSQVNVLPVVYQDAATTFDTSSTPGQALSISTPSVGTPDTVSSPSESSETDPSSEFSSENRGLSARALITSPYLECPVGQRRDLWGNCRNVF